MKFISIIALVFAGTALALVLNRKPENKIYIPAPAGETNKALKDELLKLQMRIAALEKATAEKAKESEPLPVLQERVAELTTFQENLAEYALNIDPLGVIEVTEREVEEAYNTLMDESRSPGERAKQASLLKRFGLFDGAAMEAMRALFFSAENPNEKAAALTALKGYVTPDVRDGILEAFTVDAANGYRNSRLRYAAIEALEPLIPDPEIEAMLSLMAHNDPEPRIAARAARSMGLPIKSATSGGQTEDGVDSLPASDQENG